MKCNALIITVTPPYTLIFECTKASNSTVWVPHGTNTPVLWIIVLIISCHSDIWNVHIHFRCIEVLQPGCDRFLLGWRDRRWLRRGSDERGRPREYCQVGINVWNKQRVLMHGHQGWNVRHGLCHIYMRYVYICVVYSLCFFYCLFITVTWWYVWLFVIILWLFIISYYSLYKKKI